MSTVRRTQQALAALAVVVLVGPLAACSGGSGGTANTAAPTGGNITAIAAGDLTTGTATADVAAVTWYGGYRPVITLNPIGLADYPEETAIPNMCEPALRVTPDYQLTPGLVTKWVYADPTHLVLTVRSGVRFWDGQPMTAQDVAYSIGRNIVAKYASNYAASFDDLLSVKATNATTVTLTLKRRSVAVLDALGTLGGAVVEQAFAEKAGPAFGSPKVGVMCTGPYEFSSYDGTSKLVMTRNENYWNPAAQAHAKTFTFVYPSDPSAIANGLMSGSIDGAFNLPPDLVDQLKSARSGKLFIGAAGSTPINVDLLFTRSSGTAGNVAVRQALSQAIDRAGIAATVDHGTADPLYKVTGPGMWGYSRPLFQAAYQKIAYDPTAAKKLIEQAGATGQSLVMTYPANDTESAQLAQVVQQEASAIGLKIVLHALPGQQYGSLFSDPKARAPFDILLNKNYVELPEPVLLDEITALPNGSTNFSGYSNPTVTDALNQAAGTEDDDARAKLVLVAEAQLAKDLPSIPLVQPRAIVFENSALTGATLTFSYMSSPWAAAIGGK